MQNFLAILKTYNSGVRYNSCRSEVETGQVTHIESVSFSDYIEAYKNLVYTICYSFVKNGFDAEDLAQETFLSAFKSFDRFDRRNPKSWFATIAANKCRDFLKSSARRVTAVDAADLEYIADTAPSVEDEAEVKFSQEEARRLCGRLKDPYRAVAVAYYCEDLTLAEISKLTGDNPKPVATRLYRAKKLLKIILSEEESA